MVLQCRIKNAGYRKSEPVLTDIQFDIHPGELVGLIGPNGAGKSSTIKALLGVLEHMDGDIELDNYSYIPERPFFYPGLTLMEQFTFLFSTLQTDEQRFFNQLHRLLEIFELHEVVNHYPDSFSKGMQQKAMIIFAFLKQPNLHILDEPFMGLDPTITKTLLDMLQEEKKRGAGILMSTHVLDTAEKICDRFLLILDGKLIAQGTLADIQAQSGLPGYSLFDCFHVLTERVKNEK